MEAWSLPTAAAVRLEKLELDLGAERMAGPDGALVRGGHWRNFQVKYEESNRLHKKMLALSALCRLRGDPPEARRAVGRGQCNDAYWHGVFGGLYLPHLRQGVWRELARAEEILRAGEALECDILDLDYDGNEEIWVHSSSFSAVISPARGGAIEELTLFGSGSNCADTLTRRREAYHQLRRETETQGETNGEMASEHAPSIHDIEQGLRMDELPPVDLDPRALFVDRVLPSGLTSTENERAAYRPLASWARSPLAFRIEQAQDEIVVEMVADDGAMRKRVRFNERGSVRVSHSWTVGAFPAGAYFASEISLAAPANLTVEGGAEIWRFPIETVAKSERGLERTVQGESITLRWPIEEGEGAVTLEPLMVAEPVRA